jgi:hypothetical protein
MTTQNNKLSKKERVNLIRQIRQASGVAQYALEEKLTDEQVIQASQNLEVLSLIKSANDYNRYCQGRKTAEANAKLKEFMNLENSEIYQTGKWLFNALSKKGKERKDNLLEKDLVHKEDYNQDVSELRAVIIEQKQGEQEQINKASQKIKALENKIDSLRNQLAFIQDYISNNYGRNKWEQITSYLKNQ